MGLSIFLGFRKPVVVPPSAEISPLLFPVSRTFRKTCGPYDDRHAAAQKKNPLREVTPLYHVSSFLSMFPCDSLYKKRTKKSPCCRRIFSYFCIYKSKPPWYNIRSSAHATADGYQLRICRKVCENGLSAHPGECFTHRPLRHRILKFIFIKR